MCNTYANIKHSLCYLFVLFDFLNGDNNGAVLKPMCHLHNIFSLECLWKLCFEYNILILL